MDKSTALADPELVAKYVQLDALLDEIAGLSSDSCSDAEIAELAIAHERLVRRMGSLGHARVMDVAERAAYQKTGHQTLESFLAGALRVPNPRQRVRQMDAVAPRLSMLGEVLEPVCPHTAEALAQGAIGGEHVQVIVELMRRIPSAVDEQSRAAAEETMAGYARDFNVRALTELGRRVLAHLDPDGSLTDDRDRARQRRLSVRGADEQSMSTLAGVLDPMTRAMFDVVLAAWAAPGMNNPDDELSPAGSIDDVDPQALKEAAGRDGRSQEQRNHDAFAAMLKCALDGGMLGGSHRGLPPHLIVTISEEQLRERAGFARTASGADLPISDVVELAARATPWLAVFANQSSMPLYLGRGSRLANRAQRMAMVAGYGGCSHPGCPQPATQVEAHHAQQDWAQGGLTDIDSLAPACGKHNRAVGPNPGQWRTELITEGPDAGRFGWVLNAADGIEESPPAVNHLHLVGEVFRRHLDPRAPTGSASVQTLPTPNLAPPQPDPRSGSERSEVASNADDRVEIRMRQRYRPRCRVDITFDRAIALNTS